MGGGFSTDMNKPFGSWQAQVGRGTAFGQHHQQSTPTSTYVPQFGQQKGANVLDTSGAHYSFQGQLSAPHF